MSLPSSLSRNFGPDGLCRHVVGEVVPGHRLGHAPPDAEQGLAVDVGLRERDVGAGGDRSLAVLRGEGDCDHPAHRRAVYEHTVEAERVEQGRTVVGPALDRELLVRVVGGAVAARVEGQEAEAGLLEALVHEAEVVTAEQPAAELEDRGTVLGPEELVVETGLVGDPGVRHGRRKSDTITRAARLLPRRNSYGYGSHHLDA